MADAYASRHGALSSARISVNGPQLDRILTDETRALCNDLFDCPTLSSVPTSLHSYQKTNKATWRAYHNDVLRVLTDDPSLSTTIETTWDNPPEPDLLADGLADVGRPCPDLGIGLNGSSALSGLGASDDTTLANCLRCLQSDPSIGLEPFPSSSGRPVPYPAVVMEAASDYEPIASVVDRAARGAAVALAMQHQLFSLTGERPARQRPVFCICASGTYWRILVSVAVAGQGGGNSYVSTPMRPCGPPIARPATELRPRLFPAPQHVYPIDHFDTLHAKDMFRLQLVLDRIRRFATQRHRLEIEQAVRCLLSRRDHPSTHDCGTAGEA
ncbi:uncharacterized protein PSFLO_05341 [Pseudozyma flocculosa]|uniref:Uncharacterized protein n=1 Tax=Pseudozyma flocculosa TaxID=84751 RepID=A0A5C3F6R4_9BASI|nr:uncharacterized protein PSFLO_05341 [Pseudozyma flocculosa]